jgi:hypothetical protein
MRKQRKNRSAHILFASNTPFKLKIVKCRKKYSRKTKHQGSSHED